MEWVPEDGLRAGDIEAFRMDQTPDQGGLKQLEAYWNQESQLQQGIIAVIDLSEGSVFEGYHPEQRVNWKMIGLEIRLSLAQCGRIVKSPIPVLFAVSSSVLRSTPGLLVVQVSCTKRRLELGLKDRSRNSTCLSCRACHGLVRLRSRQGPTHICPIQSANFPILIVQQIVKLKQTRCLTRPPFPVT